MGDIYVWYIWFHFGFTLDSLGHTESNATKSTFWYNGLRSILCRMVFLMRLSYKQWKERYSLLIRLECMHVRDQPTSKFSWSCWCWQQLPYPSRFPWSSSPLTSRPAAQHHDVTVCCTMYSETLDQRSAWGEPTPLFFLFFTYPSTTEVGEAPQMTSWSVSSICFNQGSDWYGIVWFLLVISWRLKGKVQPDRAHPSPGRTHGHWVCHGTLPPIWPSSSYSEDIHPVMPCSYQLFHP